LHHEGRCRPLAGERKTVCAEITLRQTSPGKQYERDAFSSRSYCFAFLSGFCVALFIAWLRVAPAMALLS
jgi:hypothetical protein